MVGAVPRLHNVLQGLEVFVSKHDRATDNDLAHAVSLCRQFGQEWNLPVLYSPEVGRAMAAHAEHMRELLEEDEEELEPEPNVGPRV